MQNRRLQYFPIILLVLSVAAACNASAQLRLLSDSLRRDTLTKAPYSFLPGSDCGMFLVPYDQSFLLVQDSAWFAELVESKRFIGQCADFVPPDVDYSRNAVVGLDLFVDCNATTSVELAYDSTARKYIIMVDELDGGCRGMKSIGYWLLIPALKEGETIEMKTHRRDRRGLFEE